MTRPLRVVLIDDSPADMLLMQESFSGLQDLATLTGYRSGAAALEAMLHPEAALPDLLLIDIKMPGMDGFDLLSMLKSNARLRIIPVVMLAASDEAEDVSKAYGLFASAYIIKATTLAESVKQMEALVRFWRGSQSVSWSTAKR